MAFKVSNETKVGALTAISITLLILGFNFLKGNNPMKRSQYIFAKFKTIEGLVPANPVMCNGLVIGSVYKTEPADELLSEVLVTIRLTEAVKLPNDSKATIKGNLLSTPVVEITKGLSTVYFVKGDTIQTQSSSGFLGEVLEQLGPTQLRLNNALGHLDTLLKGVNNVLDYQTQSHLRHSVAHLSTITANLSQTTSSLNTLIKQQNNSIAKSIENLQSTSQNLKDGTQNLPAITKNMENVSQQLSDADIKGIIKKLDGTISELQATLASVTNDKGTVGALLNERKLYENLNSTINSMNLLLQDLRLHPKRYVNVSVFGRKDKSEPLMKPMVEDSLTQEQIRNQ